jgi:hypothetical protein
MPSRKKGRVGARLHTELHKVWADEYPPSVPTAVRYDSAVRHARALALAERGYPQWDLNVALGCVLCGRPATRRVRDVGYCTTHKAEATTAWKRGVAQGWAREG